MKNNLVLTLVVLVSLLSSISYAQILEPLGLALKPADSLLVQEIVSTSNKSEYQDRGTEHTVVCSRQFKYIPVFESSMLVAVTQNGEVWSAINRLKRVDPHLPVEPKLSLAAALSLARDALHDTTAEPESEGALCILAPSHLVWRFNFLMPHFKEMMIDALSGEIVLKRKNVRDASERMTAGASEISIEQKVNLSLAKMQRTQSKISGKGLEVSTDQKADLKLIKPQSLSAQSDSEAQDVSSELQVDLEQDKMKVQSSAQELSEEADLIVTAEVSAQRSYIREDQNGNHIYTEVTLLPLQNLKGMETATNITIEVIGGTFEGWREAVSNAPVFEKGEVAVLFLKSNPYRLVADRQAKRIIRDGKFTIEGFALTPTAFSKALGQFYNERGTGMQLREILEQLAENTDDGVTDLTPAPTNSSTLAPTNSLTPAPVTDVLHPCPPGDLGGGQLLESELQKKTK